jgi:miniconductance mechanosensitive channel
MDKTLGLPAMAEWINNWLLALGMDERAAAHSAYLILIGLVVVVVVVADLVCHYGVVNIISKVVKKTKATWDDILFDRKALNNLSHVVAPWLLYLLLPLVVQSEGVLDFLKRMCMVYIVAVLLRFVNAFLSGLYTIYSDRDASKNRPLKGLLQTGQVVAFCISAIIIVSLVINRSPAVLLTGLGASAAVLMLVFKDSIMGFVSGIQLSLNDMLRVGDWITMPKYGADGNVIEVTLNTVKVRNWDNTITTIPPYALVSDSFQNWRGMSESDGRRVKRSVNIDMSRVRFCTKEQIERFRRMPLLTDYINRATASEGEGGRLTNLGVFRMYLTLYINHHVGVNHSMISMVRQLQPTAMGIPLELYFFTKDKSWVPYENLQADVFDHLLAVIGEFDLQVFQCGVVCQ